MAAERILRLRTREYHDDDDGNRKDDNGAFQWKGTVIVSPSPSPHRRANHPEKHSMKWLIHAVHLFILQTSGLYVHHEIDGTDYGLLLSVGSDISPYNSRKLFCTL